MVKEQTGKINADDGLHGWVARRSGLAMMMVDGKCAIPTQCMQTHLAHPKDVVAFPLSCNFPEARLPQLSVQLLAMRARPFAVRATVWCVGWVGVLHADLLRAAA